MLSIPFFFLLIAKLSNFETGLLASVFYSFTPLGIFTSRSFIPDPMSLSLAVIGLYYFLTWTDSMRFAHLALAASAVSGAILVKAPYAMILAPIAYLSIRRYGRAAVRVKALWFFAVVAILPAVVWYSHALAIPTATPTLAGKPHFFGEQGVGFASTRDVSEVVERNFWYYFTPVTGVLSVAGLVLFWRESHRGKMFHYLLIAMIVFVVVVGPGNRMHPWYQLPLLPVTSAFAAGGLDYVIRRLPARISMP
jgi:4-amino-4-deoxy-L-arabinose transferase-like glycosyltransferase